MTAMKGIGFLSFGHWSDAAYSVTRPARGVLLQSIDLAVATAALGADGVISGCATSRGSWPRNSRSATQPAELAGVAPDRH